MKEHSKEDQSMRLNGSNDVKKKLYKYKIYKNLLINIMKDFRIKKWSDNLGPNIIEYI